MLIYLLYFEHMCFWKFTCIKRKKKSNIFFASPSGLFPCRGFAEDLPDEQLGTEQRSVHSAEPGSDPAAP